MVVVVARGVGARVADGPGGGGGGAARDASRSLSEGLHRVGSGSVGGGREGRVVVAEREEGYRCCRHGLWMSQGRIESKPAKASGGLGGARY